jgi:hypothetical protein
VTDIVDQAADRLYALLPAHIRAADAAGGAPLHAYLAALATGTVAIDAEIDRLLGNLFVETADPIGLANLARLVGAETLQPLPPGAPFSLRAFVANTVRYRRGKGTPRTLEGLAADVGGVGAVVVEYFQRLARTAPLIDPRPERPGIAGVTDGDTAARIDTGFDRTPRLADVRSIAHAGGPHGVANVGVHVMRLQAPEYPAPAGAAVAPAALAGVPAMQPWLTTGGAKVPGYFQLSPFAGGRAPLVNPNRRDETGDARAAGPTRVDRLRRLPICREIEARRRALVAGRALPQPAWFDAEGQPFTLFIRRKSAAQFERVPREQLLIVNLEMIPTGKPRPDLARLYSWAVPGAVNPQIKSGNAPIVAAFDPATGRAVFAKAVLPGDEVTEARLAHAYGLGDTIGAGPHDRTAARAPSDIGKADFLRVVDAFGIGLEYVDSLAKALADWAAETTAVRGFIVLARCDTETPLADFAVTLRADTELHIVAAKWQPKQVVAGVTDLTTRRGYLVRAGRRFVIGARLAVSGVAAPGSRPGALVLDGVTLTGGIELAAAALSELWLRSVTARTAGAAAVTLAAPPASLHVTVEQSIIGPLALGTVAAPGNGRLTIDRSILTGEGALAVIEAPGFAAALTDATLLGSARVKTLEATGVIFQGVVTAIRRQAGCVRYSSIATGSTTPRRFRCQPDLAVADSARARGLPALPPTEADRVRQGLVPVFLDIDPDEPTLGLLSPLCAPGIRAGGEGGKEMGAFAGTGEPMRFANVVTLFDDYLPAALEAGLLDDTRGKASTQRRTVP